MRVADLRSVKPVVLKSGNSKRTVLESWVAENLQGERGNLSKFAGWSQRAKHQPCRITWEPAHQARMAPCVTGAGGDQASRVRNGRQTGWLSDGVSKAWSSQERCLIVVADDVVNSYPGVV